MAPHDSGSWRRYVNCFVEAFAMGREMAGEVAADLPPSAVGDEGPTLGGAGGVVLCSPHPDDEVLTGALAYRLERQDRVAVRNLVMTLGSDPGRQEARRLEVAAACRELGFAWQLVAPPLAFAQLTPAAKSGQPESWAEKVGIVARLFDQLRPAVVLCPHRDDGHQTHCGVHLLVVEALQRHSRHTPGPILLVESEFWHPLAAPNLMVGISPADAAALITALSCHQGEVQRNPYHLRQPARWMDTVRRGGELLGGYGGVGVDFLFAELYRVSSFERGRQLPWARGRLVVGPEEELTLAKLLAP